MFDQKGEYSDPELTFNSTLGLTAIKLFDLVKLGKRYGNDSFVSDANGNIYNFDLNKDRTKIILEE